VIDVSLDKKIPVVIGVGGGELLVTMFCGPVIIRTFSQEHSVAIGK